MFFRKKSLEDHFKGTKRIKVEGIIFEIKKIDPLSHLQGINAIQKIYEIYKTKDEKRKAEQAIENAEKLKKVLKEIILAGVVKPKLSAKPDSPGFHVDEILKDVFLSRELAAQIIKHTYKKKFTTL